MNVALLALLERFMSGKSHAPLSDALVGQRASSSHSPRAIESRSSTETLVGEGSLSSPDSPAPGQHFSGGIQPKCLEPCHDKLAQLKEKLGCAEEPHQALPLEDALPRLSTKRALEPSGADELEASEDCDGVAPVARCTPAMKKPAAAPKATPKSAGRHTSSVHAALLKRPAKVERPPQSESPTTHAGGKIYWSPPKSAYRVYLRIGDRIEKQVKANPDSKHDMRQKFLICCALIEDDKRPVRAS